MDCVVPLQRDNSNEMNIEMKCLSPVVLMQCPAFTLASSQKTSTELAAATYLFNCKQSILKITPIVACGDVTTYFCESQDVNMF